MPELPEVKTLSQHIIKHFKDQSLKKINIVKGRYQKHGPPEYFNEFNKEMPLLLVDMIQKGKVMVFCFEKDWYMISRLGLTGWWYIDEDKPSWIKSDPNLVFEFKNKTLYYVDPLSYGTVTFYNSKEAVNKELSKLAPDYLSITLKELQERLQKKPILLKKTLEEVMVDQQSLMSGIGNYLKAEILYDVKLSPFRTLNTLTENDWKNILHSAKQITKKIQKNIGNDQKYVESMKIYGKDTDPLGNKVLHHKTKNGRTTHWVKEIQM